MSEDNQDLPKSEAKRPAPKKRAPAVIEGEAVKIEGVEQPSMTAEGAAPASEPPAAAEAMSTTEQPVMAEKSSANPLLAGAIAGAVAGVLVAGIAYFAVPPAGTPKLESDIAPRLAAFDKRLKDVEARPALPDVGEDILRLSADIKGLKQAFGALESRASTAPASAPQPAGAANEDVAALRKALAALEQKIAGFASTAQVSGDLAALRREIAARSGSEGDNKALLLVSVDLMKSTLDRGQPFASELEAARGLGLAPAAADKLKTYAETGLPTVGQLGGDFSARANAMIDTLTPQADGVLERLVQSAKKLIHIRPVGEVAGAEPAAVIARIETRLQQGNAAAALAEFKNLPERTRAAAGQIPALLAARAEADALLSSLIAELVKSLPKRG